MVDVKAIRAELVRKGMTQAELAEKIGMSTKTLYLRLKHGVFGTDEAEQIAEVLSLDSPGEIFFAKTVS